MRVTPEPGVEARHLLMHHGVPGDAGGEVLELRDGRELAVEQEISGLEEGAVLCKLIDRIAAIKQDAFVAVDKRDLRLATRRGGEAGIEGEMLRVLIKRGDVDHVGAQRALADRQVEPRAVDQDRCLGRTRRTDFFCDAHLETPLNHPEGGIADAGLDTVASRRRIFCSAT
jgi:hypothetical protein